MKLPFSRRVVATGLGIVSPLGLNTYETWQAVLEGKSGIGYIKGFEDTTPFSQIAGTIKNFTLDLFKVKNLDRIDPFIQYGLKAAQEAILDAKIDGFESIDKSRVGVSIGSGLGGFHSFEKQHHQLLKANQSKSSPFRFISPFFIPGSIMNMVSGLCAMEYGFKGPNFSVSSACATGAHNIGMGARTIAAGDADMMVVGGAEMSSTLLSVAGFSACRALSKNHSSPKQASRPWDQNRDGFVLADGAAVLVLEEYQHAVDRKIPIYGEVLGFGMSADAYHMTAPDREGLGAQLAMQHALSDAQIKPQEIDYINAHATSTVLGDVVELKAIEAIWGESAQQLKISSTKSMTGHLLGAAGSLEAAFCLLAIRDQKVPGTMNLDIIDADYTHLNLVPHHAQQGIINTALSNAFGFGGTNTALIFKKL